MDKLIQLIVKIKNYDKYFHLIIGTTIMVLVGQYNTLAAEIATFIASRGKEMYDKGKPNHSSDGWDAFSTALGIIPGHIILMYQQEILAYLKLILT